MIRVIALMICFLCLSEAKAAEDRLWFDTAIKGKPVRLAIDTGAENSVLFRQTAENLGVFFTPASTNTEVPAGEVAVGSTEPLALTIGDTTNNCSFSILNLPHGLRSKFGGFIGWPHLRDSIIHIDAANYRVEFLDRVPPVVEYEKFPLRRDTDFLELMLPESSFGKNCVTIDTGADDGVDFCPEKWNQWVTDHPSGPQTLSASWMPGSGLVVDQIYWANRVVIGSLELSKVSVSKANTTQIAAGGWNYLATLGLGALKRFDLIIDGKTGFVYFKQNGVTTPPRHNRAGAVFVPETMDSDDLLAHVLEGSPGYESGIRDGDKLLAIDGTDATHWRTDPNITINSRFWEQEPGTKVQLKVKRKDKEFETTVVLRDLLGSEVEAGIGKIQSLKGK